jgi:DNA-binding response OmpR family regulator
LFRLFRRLARPANHYVSTERLLEDVWGDERSEDTTVRSAVRNLRRKLERAGMARLAEGLQGRAGHYRLLLDRNEARRS